MCGLPRRYAAMKVAHQRQYALSSTSTWQLRQQALPQSWQSERRAVGSTGSPQLHVVVMGSSLDQKRVKGSLARTTFAPSSVRAQPAQ